MEGGIIVHVWNVLTLNCVYGRAGRAGGSGCERTMEKPGCLAIGLDPGGDLGDQASGTNLRGGGLTLTTDEARPRPALVFHRLPQEIGRGPAASNHLSRHLLFSPTAQRSPA